jgi:hypothetical protein
VKRLVISLVSAAACWGFVLASGTARASSIGVYFDLQATTACAEQHPVTPGTAYILAVLDQIPSEIGIAGAGFRVDGMPTDWSATVVPRSGGDTIGNPLTGGCVIGFPCQASHIVLLYTIHYTVVSDLMVRLNVHEQTPPSNPPLACPVIDLGSCETAEGVWFCVSGGTAAINDPSFCTVGVEPSTWSRVKSLYER